MTSGRINLPGAPLVATAIKGPLDDAPVEAHLLEGTRLRGNLAEFDPARGLVILQPQESTQHIPIPFANLRFLRFMRKLPINRGSHPARERGDLVTMPDPEREYSIIFTDGKRIEGRTRGTVTDESGIHLFHITGNDHVQRLFVPQTSIKDSRLGPLLGQSIMNSSMTNAQQISVALLDQQQRRVRKIGSYLQDQAAVNTEQLEQALERQTKQSGSSGKKVGELLMEEQLITPDQLHTALDIQRGERNKKLGEILVEMKVLNPEEVYVALSHKLGLPLVKLENFNLDPDVLDLIPEDTARRYLLMPLFLYRNRLVVAMADPTNNEALDMARFITGRNIEPVIAMKDEIIKAINHYYGTIDSAAAIEELKVVDQRMDEAQKEHERREAERMSQEKPIVRLVNGMIYDGIRRRASDIHVRPLEHKVDLLYRIDGSMIHIKHFSKALLPAIVSRIKIIGSMDISERRLPQDGRSSMVIENNVVDLRISIIPTVEGESVVIRILNTAQGLKSVNDLGFGERDHSIFTDLLHKSYGILLVTGPTGSGKSTTLYAALQEIRKQDVNIITVENPVEYHLDGIEQIQVNPVTNFTFARALRHILRHDPDVIMIGEIRDQETAKIAIESALTGHLVLSTLHTNDAASAVTRFMEMGIEPYMLSSTLLGVLAQRLVKRNCKHCMEEEKVDEAIRRLLKVSDDEVFYRGKGCEHCNQTGYSGRLGVYELLAVNRELQDCIVGGVTANQVHDQAIKDGMITLTENALAQARLRKTSLAEVYRVRLE